MAIVSVYYMPPSLSFSSPLHTSQVEYSLTSESASADSKRHIGFIAQEVEIEVPEVVVSPAGEFKSIDYSKLSALLVKSIQEESVGLTRRKEILSEQRTRLVELEIERQRLRDATEQLVSKLVISVFAYRCD
jgi:hypothetical protein